MGTYVDIALRIHPDRFAHLVPMEPADGAGCGLAGGMLVELGADFVRLCTLNGAGWTVAQIVAEARQKLGDQVFDEVGPDGVAVSLECALSDGGAHTFDARLAQIPCVWGAMLDDLASHKVIDVTLGPAMREEIGVVRRRLGLPGAPPSSDGPGISAASSDWLDTLASAEEDVDEHDVDEQAERYLRSVDREAILRAMRTLRGEGG